MKLHHLGYLCANIETGLNFLKSKTPIISHQLQILDGDIPGTQACLVIFENDEKIELICGDSLSPSIEKPLTLYFLCYQIDNIRNTYNEYKNKGALDILIPTPSKLFNNQLIAVVEYQSTIIKFIEILYGVRNERLTQTSQMTTLLQSSYNQQWLWFLDSLSSSSWHYNMPISLNIEGNLNILALKLAFGKIIERHDSLRTVFRNQNGTIFRLILEDYDPPFFVTNAENYSETDIKNQIEIDEKNRFLLNGKDLLFKLHLLKLSKNKYVLMLIMHHSVFDGWSFDILFSELEKLYSYYAHQAPLALKNIKINYSTYISQQNTLLSSIKTEKNLLMWKKLLTDAPQLQFPSDYPRPEVQKFYGKYIPFTLHDHTIFELSKLSKLTHSSKFMILLCVFYSMLARYSNQNDFVFGTPISGRGPEAKDIIGYFTNIIPVRIHTDSTYTFRDLLHIAKNFLLSTFESQEIPFGKIVETLNIQRDISKNPVFQILFAYQNIGISQLALENLKISPYRDGYNSARFDFTFEVEDRGNEIKGGIYYNTDLFSENTANQILSSFQNILEKTLKDPETKISELSLLSESASRSFLKNLNIKHTYTRSTDNFFIKDFFENQVIKNKNQIALKFNHSEITYKQLNEKSNQIANFLHSRGCKHGTIIGVGTGKCLELIISIMACFKAGFVYLPLETDYPKDRLEYIIENSQLKAIITTEEYYSLFMNVNVEIINLEKDCSLINAQKITSPDVLLNPHDNAYLFYTSGSTGRPKGSFISQSNIVNLFKSTQLIFDFTPNDKIILFHSYAFDVSLWEILSALCFGFTLVIPKKEDILSVDLFYNILVSENITILNETPSAFEQLLLYEKEFGSKKLKLRYIVLGGESLKPKILEPWFDLYGSASCKVVNMYGITETTIYSSYLEITKEMTKTSRSNIGVGIPGVELYVLDQNMQLVPPNVIGEIYIAGHGVGQGYLNLPELTAQKFLEAPLALSRLSTKLYKTGDIGRYFPNHEIEFLGRIDNQVKIRGYRIELEEIEAVLMEHPYINEALAHVQTDDTNNNFSILIAYVVCSIAEKNEIIKNELELLIERKVPNYMKPQIIFLEKFPLNLNNKIDRSKLPKVIFKKNMAIVNLPSTKLETEIAEVWKEILAVQTADIDVNFFDIGGNSLFAMELHSKLIAAYPINLKIIDLFTYSTIRKLAEFIQTIDKNHESSMIYSSNTLSNTEKNENTIAIIGFSGKFPHSPDIETFWKNIENGLDCLDHHIIHKIHDENFISSSGIIDDLNCFDAEFFNCSPNEANLTDPQHRLFLECAYTALEHAGYPSTKCKEKISVFAGMGDNDYLELILSSEINPDTLRKRSSNIRLKTLNHKDYLATKVSYKLNLQGPSLNINTACSSSLVAIINACDNLINNHSTLSIAGGVSLVLPERAGYFYESSSIFSKDGYCRAFDANSTGTVPSSGVGAVILKRLKNAIDDRDTIYGVIHGYAQNNDGNDKISFAAPSLHGQINCITEALQAAKVHPKEVSYIEAHGTGTFVGDSIELEALTQVFKKQTDKERFCGIGSVKNNIGHAQAAAGIAGLIKSIYILNQKTIPPHINFKTPNPILDLDDTPFYINTEKKSLKNTVTVGISSFGIGGTNSHIIIKNHIQQRHDVNTEDYKLIILSARNNDTLDKYRILLKKTLEEKNNSHDLHQNYLDDLAYTLQVGRTDFAYRQAWICTDIQDAINKLSALNNKIICDFNQNSNHFMTLYSVANNWLDGAEINWSTLHSNQRHRVSAPTYPFQKNSYWYDAREERLSIISNETTIKNKVISNEQILSVIQNCLGYDEISLSDNFLNLGGDSLVALNIANKLEYLLEKKVIFENLINSINIGEFIKKLHVNEEKKHIKHLKLLKDGNKNFQSLFIVHPGNGSLYMYERILENFNYMGAVWGIENSIFDTSYKPFSSIVTMAEYYLSLIKSVQTTGPYLLAGWSLGASVAFEIARLIESEGGSVKKLILIDGWYKFNPRLNEENFFYNLHRNDFDKINNEKNALLINLLLTRFTIFMEYHPKEINTPISLIKAKELTEEFNVSDDYNNWKPFALGGITVNLIPGDHLSIFSQNNISELRRTLGNLLMDIS